MITLEKVNSWAQKSCAKWNKNRLSRKFYRKKYHRAARKSWRSPDHHRLIARYQEGAHYINTYPWPYKDPNFANWEENDTPTNYSLISDQSCCVIRYSTSYCAWKIFEATGTWPQKTSTRRFNAKHWQQFLAEAGYTDVVTKIDPNHYYVGINPNEGEWGVVVWYEANLRDSPSDICVSSYIDHKYELWRTTISDFTWIKIK